MIFGYRAKGEADWTGFLKCPTCVKWCPHYGVKTRRWFTLFFIPVVPLWTTRQVMCARCLRKEKMERTAYEVSAAKAKSNAAIVEEYKNEPTELKRRLAASNQVDSLAG
jgi:hypothetical protein